MGDIALDVSSEKFKGELHVYEFEYAYIGEEKYNKTLNTKDATNNFIEKDGIFFIILSILSNFCPSI
ncbi:MAG: hypothetical protein ACLS5Y_07205 [Clostridia bacterium]